MSTKTHNPEKSLGTLSPVDVQLHQIPVVELSQDQIRRSGELAIDRNKSYREIDGGTVFGHQSSLTSHQIGILGEMAVSELYATEIDNEKHELGDGGIDLELWGTTVDVKSTATDKMDYPQLLVDASDELNADLYILTHVVQWGTQGAKIRVFGCADWKQLDEKSPYRHPGRRENLVVEPEELALPPLVQPCNRGKRNR